MKVLKHAAALFSIVCFIMSSVETVGQVFTVWHALGQAGMLMALFGVGHLLGGDDMRDRYESVLKLMHDDHGNQVARAKEHVTSIIDAIDASRARASQFPVAAHRAPNINESIDAVTR